MEHVLFLSPHLSDDAALTPSSEVTSLPAAFVQNQEPTKVWRTAGVTAEHLIFDFGSPVVINAAAIGAHNLTGAATVQLRLAATIPDLTVSPAKNSGAVSAWPSSGKHTAPNWPHELSLVRLDNDDDAYRYARLDFVDATNPADYLDIGRIGVGLAFQPVLDIDPDPAIGFVPNGVQEPNGYGQTFTDPRPWAQRQFDINFSNTTEGDVHDYAMELSRLRGLAGDVFVFLDPSATTRFHQWSMQALFSGRAVYRARAAWKNSKQIWSFAASLIEKL